MPWYCYTTEDGKTTDVHFAMGSAPPNMQIDGKRAYRDRAAEGATGYVKGSKTPVKRGYGKWPMEPCTASGVHPSQAQELRDFLGKRGCPTEVTKDGDPVYTSQRHQDKALKLRNMHNRASYN